MWQVQAILKTPADGVSKVIVLVGDKTGKQKPQVLSFLALPDGKHIVTGDDIIDFGATPFADSRQKLQQHANGPYRGSASKGLELVEFADFQCPHCKEAQANMDKLVADYPKARIVFQNFPIASIHPQATLAAEYGVCVTKLGGSSAFFQYAAAVFDGQDGLARPTAQRSPSTVPPPRPASILPRLRPVPPRLRSRPTSMPPFSWARIWASSRCLRSWLTAAPLLPPLPMTC